MSSLDNYFNTNTGLGINQDELTTIQNNLNLLDAKALYIDGSKSMTGDLNLGTTNDIINVDNTTTNKIYLTSPTNDYQGCLFIDNGAGYVDLPQQFTINITSLSDRITTAEGDINTLEANVFYKNGSQSAGANSTWNMSNSTITGGNICNFLTYQINGVAITANADELNMSDISGAKGTAQADKVLTVDTNRDLININSLTTYNINATTLNGSAIGSLANLIYLDVKNPPYTNGQVTAYYTQGGTLAGKAIITHPTGNHVFGLGNVGCTKCVTNEIENPASVNGDLKLSATKFNLIIQNYGTTGTIDVKYLTSKHFRIMTTAGTEKLKVQDALITVSVPLTMNNNFIEGVSALYGGTSQLFISNINGNIDFRYGTAGHFIWNNGAGVEKMRLNDTSLSSTVPLNMNSNYIEGVSALYGANSTFFISNINGNIDFRYGTGAHFIWNNGSGIEKMRLNDTSLSSTVSLNLSNGASIDLNNGNITSCNTISAHSGALNLNCRYVSGGSFNVKNTGDVLRLSINNTETTSYLPLNMNTANKITNLANGTVSTDAINLGQLNSSVANYLPLAGGTLGGTLNMNQNTISGLLRVNCNDSSNKIDIWSGSTGFPQKIFTFDSTGITAGISSLSLKGLLSYWADSNFPISFKNDIGTNTFLEVGSTQLLSYVPLNMGAQNITNVNSLNLGGAGANLSYSGNDFTMNAHLSGNLRFTINNVLKAQINNSSMALTTSLDLNNNDITSVKQIIAHSGGANLDLKYYSAGNLRVYNNSNVLKFNISDSVATHYTSLSMNGTNDITNIQALRASSTFGLFYTTANALYIKNSAGTTRMNITDTYIETYEKVDFRRTDSSISSTIATASHNLTINHNGSGYSAMLIFGIEGGNYGINSQSPVTTDAYHMLFTNPNGLRGYISTNGTNTFYTNLSDYRTKKEIEEMDYKETFKKLKKIKACSYKFIKDDTDKRYCGFIAHELQEAGYGNCVVGEKDAYHKNEKGIIEPFYQCVDYSKLVPDLVCCTQGLIKENKELALKLSDSIGELSTLKERVLALEHFILDMHPKK